MEEVGMGKHIQVHEIELTPEQREGLTCRNVDHLPGPTERREWLDEFEEAGWTKTVQPDGAIEYERPCNGSREWRLFRRDGGYSSGHPIDPKIMARMPVLKERRRWWQFWKRDR